MPHLVLLALLVIPVGLYLLLAGLVFCFQDKILYPAFLVPGLETSLKRNPAWHATFLRSGTRYRIRCVIGICSSEKARNVTALIFHSNACPDMEQYARYFFRKGCHVVIPTHRGYGTSEGSPSQKALLEDAQAAIDYCMDHWTLRGTKLLIFGWSMGGAVACHIAAKNPNATNALIILNTWDTFKHVQQYFWPARPFPLSFRDKWDNLEAIKSLGPNTSILILNSRDDGIVPPDSSVQNLLAARSRPVNPATVNHSMLTFGDHASPVTYRHFFDTIDDFLHDTGLVPYVDIHRSPSNSVWSQDADAGDEHSMRLSPCLAFRVPIYCQLHCDS